jgi:signal transduction histidine kinase
MAELATSNSPPDLSSLLEALRVSEERGVAGLLALEIMHEIRNPLEALSNLIFLTNLESDNPDKIHQYMRLADEQIRTVAEITKHTLGFVRAAESQHAVELVPIAEAALRVHQRAIEQKNLRLIKDLNPVIAPAISRGEMLQVLSNLVANAVDVPENGTLHVRVRRSGDEVCVTVADNGPGIPAENYQKIFRPFFTTKSGRGTGLGLALSKKIVDRYRGRIRVRSSTLGGKSGTVFRIAVPTSPACGSV